MPTSANTDTQKNTAAAIFNSNTTITSTNANTHATLLLFRADWLPHILVQMCYPEYWCIEQISDGSL